MERHCNALSVLLVDDQPFQRSMVRRHLLALGVQTVIEASDGREAVALLETPGMAVDLIISDLDMPHMDGLEFMRRVRLSGSTTALAILSALDRSLLNSVESMAQELGLTLTGIVEKPANRDRLKLILDRYARDSAGSSVPGGDRRPANVHCRISTEDVVDGLDRGDIVPYLQPKVRLSDGVVVGAEALARWRHRDQGVLGPGMFISQIESTPHMRRFTESIFASAAAAARTLADHGFPIQVSVNVSFSVLNDPRLSERLLAIADEQGVLPSTIILEVTENVAMNHAAHAIENLARLRMRGFGLSIDDFGTGYASLQHLLRIPFAELKLDRSFVTGIRIGSLQWTLVESTISMAHKLGLDTVAEGVETMSDWRALKELGCRVAQGFLIARALPLDELLNWVRRQATLQALQPAGDAMTPWTGTPTDAPSADAALAMRGCC